MTNEEVIKKLKYCKSIHNGSFGPALKIAIKALEQEPILDKIRAEIMEFEEDIFHSTKDYSDYAVVRHCVDIIDKYRKEAGNEV